MDAVLPYVAPVVGLFVLSVPFVVGVWALRGHSRMFPQGFDRTGWNPSPTASGGSRRCGRLLGWTRHVNATVGVVTAPRV